MIRRAVPIRPQRGKGARAVDADGIHNTEIFVAVQRGVRDGPSIALPQVNMHVDNWNGLGERSGIIQKKGHIVSLEDAS
jgi:hypothetical protein